MNSNASDAEDAFAVLASRLRLRILDTLRETDTDRRYTFTGLYQAVEGPNTSQFAYHLDRLTPRYVQHTDDGYVITDAGRRIVQSMNAGEYSVEPELEPVEVSTHCPGCGATAATATYDGRVATVCCRSCGGELLRYDLQPAHVDDRDSRAALRAADRQMRAEFDSAVDGVCQRCGGSIRAGLETDTIEDSATCIVTCDCAHCGVSYSGPVGMVLLSHPAVTAHYWATDLDTRTAPLWEVLEHLSGFVVEPVDSTEVVVELPSGEQFRIRVTDTIDVQRRR